MRLLAGKGKHATVTVDEEIDLGALPDKFAYLRTMPAPESLPAAERARLEAKFPTEKTPVAREGEELRLEV